MDYFSLVRWYEQHRQQWITETLYVFGYINREHLERKFGISKPQASVDLRTYMRGHPGAMTYDKTAKRYVLSAQNKVEF